MVPALRVALSVTFESFALRRLDAEGPPVHIDLGFADDVLVPKIREEVVAGAITVEDEEEVGLANDLGVLGSALPQR
jgi:hypothetical protein